MTATSYVTIERDHADILGEGPLWSPDRDTLYWVDITGCRVHGLTLGTGSIRSWILPEMIGWLIETAGGSGFAAGCSSGVKRLTLDPFALSDWIDIPGMAADQRLNDAKADETGAIWAGTVAVTCDRPTGSLHRLSPDGAVDEIDGGYIVPNGPALSPDGRWLLHTDSGRGIIYRFPRDGAELGQREVFIRFEGDWGSPDGMTFDVDGGLWVAHWGGGRVSRFDPDGRVERSIALPASQITSMAFAGPALDRMFVTSAAQGVSEPCAGALFEVDPGCRGLAPHRFGRAGASINA